MKFSIETPRLVVRPFELNDAKDFFNITRDEDIRKFVPGCYFESLEETQEVFEKFYIKGDLKHDFYLAIVEKSTNSLVGSFIITQNQDLHTYDFCYFIQKEKRLNGYFKEAFTEFLRNSFPASFTINIASENSASWLALKKTLEPFDDIALYSSLLTRYVD